MCVCVCVCLCVCVCDGYSTRPILMTLRFRDCCVRQLVIGSHVFIKRLDSRHIHQVISTFVVFKISI